MCGYGLNGVPLLFWALCRSDGDQQGPEIKNPKRALPTAACVGACHDEFVPRGTKSRERILAVDCVFNLCGQFSYESKRPRGSRKDACKTDRFAPWFILRPPPFWSKNSSLNTEPLPTCPCLLLSSSKTRTGLLHTLFVANYCASRGYGVEGAMIRVCIMSVSTTHSLKLDLLYDKFYLVFARVFVLSTNGCATPFGVLSLHN